MNTPFRIMNKIYISLFCLLAFNVYAGCVSGDCKNGEGTFLWDGGSYTGEWRDGKRNGKGVFTWSDGSKYTGEWRDSERDGEGFLTWANGNKYTGEWRSRKRDGYGVYTWADGSKYTGEWRRGKMEGEGTLLISGLYAKTGYFFNGDYWGTIAEWKNSLKTKGKSK
ncbi:MAG: hypothetical protein ACI9LM_004943 [Alteromonadaceae bacterium]|jgi:hypothetical protein